MKKIRTKRGCSAIIIPSIPSINLFKLMVSGHYHINNLPYNCGDKINTIFGFLDVDSLHAMMVHICNNSINIDKDVFIRNITYIINILNYFSDDFQ